MNEQARREQRLEQPRCHQLERGAHERSHVVSLPSSSGWILRGARRSGRSIMRQEDTVAVACSGPVRRAGPPTSNRPR